LTYIRVYAIVNGPSKRANARPVLDPPLAVTKEKTMSESYHGLSADDYIRRIDRTILAVGSVVVAIVVALIFQIP
jgi:hypothetical protein